MPPLEHRSTTLFGAVASHDAWPPLSSAFFPRHGWPEEVAHWGFSMSSTPLTPLCLVDFDFHALLERCQCTISQRGEWTAVARKSQPAPWKTFYLGLIYTSSICELVIVQFQIIGAA